LGYTYVSSLAQSTVNLLPQPACFVSVEYCLDNMLKKNKLLFFVTEDWYFCSHRLPLALAAKKAGFDVTVVTRVSHHGELIKQAGLNLVPIDLNRRGMNPFSELNLLTKLIAIYRSEQPAVIHNVALKPVVYGSIASIFVPKARVVNAMTGLGFSFISQSFKARILRSVVTVLFRFLLNRKASHVILQNPDDVNLLSNSGIINRDKITLIRGSGVDVEQFCYEPEMSGDPVVILAARMLWDKGVGEFIKAARELKAKGVKAKFVLVGKSDDHNPSAISEAQLQAWGKEGVIEWWGHKTNMTEIFSQSHIVCLPSYREGLPKVLLEAAACGRPIVTTDVPGCREIVQHGVNGFLVPIYDSVLLAESLAKLIESSELREKMGANGRNLVKREFSIEKVNRETLALYRELLQ